MRMCSLDYSLGLRHVDDLGESDTRSGGADRLSGLITIYENKPFLE